MFNTKENLYAIFQSFEDDSSDEEEEDQEGDVDVRREGNNKTTVMTSQLRHFVIQVSLCCLILEYSLHIASRNT